MVDQQDEQTLDVTLTMAGTSLHVLAIETEPDVVDITFDFGETVIAFRTDYTRGEGEFMPSGTLDAVHGRMVTELLAELGTIIPLDDKLRTRVEDVAYRQTSFMEIVPTGEYLAPLSFRAEQGWVHIGCGCGNQYIGSGHYRTCGRGCGCTGGSGNGCKGRCGAGCGAGTCVGTTAYTQDCAKHDWGVGSFAAASDDFSFASNNCGCTGGC